MDVKTTFLNGIIEEEVYIEKPQGFEVSGKESHVCFAVNTLSQFMVEPRQEHWVATKHVLRYLRGIVEYGLRYLGDGEVKLQGYSDSDWVGSATDRKSTSGCCFSLGSMMISWFNRKQTSVALSSTEAEYMATVLLVVRPSGFASYLQDCLIRSWIPQSFTVIIRVVSNSLRIQCFMTGPSI
jgi:hypothetical protein